MPEIRNLTKSYGDQVIFSNLTLTLEDGGIYCLMAPSGKGKTTLFRILMGLEQADSGSFSGFREAGIAPVFQEDRLVPGLGAEKNIRLVNPSCTVEELRGELLLLLPEDSLKKPVSEFSGGMRRRVALMRALLSKGKVLLFDEPFTGLDEETRKLAMDYVLKRRNGRTLIFTTHHPEEASILGAKLILWDEEKCGWSLQP